LITPATASPSTFRRAPVSVVVLLGCWCLLMIAGAFTTPPGVSIAANDLAILDSWVQTGYIRDLARDPSHLTKPGYLLFLRLVMPTAGRNPFEARRFVIASAALLIVGVACAVSSLLRDPGSPAAAAFIAAILLFAPIRDSADYIASEPLAAGLGLAFCGMLGRGRLEAPAIGTALGAFAAAVVLLRPNMAWALLGVGLLVGVSKASRRTASSLALLAGFSGAMILFVIAGRCVKLPLDPIGAGSARVLLWGTADYYWAPDVDGWPVGESSAETRRLQFNKVRTRWSQLFSKPRGDWLRSLAWRLGHSVLSSEQLPSRLQWRPYWVLDKSLRYVWWVVAGLMTVASAAAAVGGTGTWRFVAIFVLGFCVLQGLVFGADPRLALPLLPIIFFALAREWRTIRWRRAWPATAAAIPIGIALVVAPDSANPDFALVRGPGRRITQAVPLRGIGGNAAVATIHVRILRPDGLPLGLRVRCNGATLLERTPTDPAPFPAFFSLRLAGDDLARARRDGVRLDLESLGDSSARESFLYYPVVPWPLDSFSAVDGRRRLPSGYGGSTAGGLAIWMHPGKD
jgi:hypothetical protein